FEPQGVARLGGADGAGQFIAAVDGPAVQRDDHVAGLQAPRVARRTGRHLGDIGALGALGQAQALAILAGQIADGHAPVAALGPLAAPQAAGRLFGDVGRDAAANADRAAGRREDRRVPADDATIDVEGRAARVAPVDGGVDLDEVGVGVLIAADGARLG